MEFLKANYEKLALGVLIAALVYVIAGQIMLIGNVDNVKLSGGGVGQIPEKKVNAPDFKQASITKDGNGPFLTKDVLYCMKQSCHFLIPSDVAHCPDCGEPVIGEPPVEVKIKDSDKDGIEDAWEIKYGLNPLDAKDASVDTDGDGFLNSEEYGDSDEDRTSPKDPEDHPALATKLSFVKTYRKTLPFVIVGLIVNDPEDKKSWDIEVKVKKGGGFRRLGDKLPGGVELVDVELNEEDETKSKIVLSSDGYGVFKVRMKRRVRPPNSQMVRFYNSITGKRKDYREGKEFTLKNKKGLNPEIYEIKKIEKTKVTLINVDLNVEVIVGKAQEEKSKSLEQLLEM